MAWLWIVAALLLSLIPLINKKIELPYYIWLLLPIDMYGLVLAGAILKPYMIFSVIVPIVIYAKNKSKGFDFVASKGQLLLGVISFLIITVTLFNNNNFASLKAAIMTLVVYICAQLCVSATDCSNTSQLNDVVIAASFGYGIVFIIAQLLFQSGIDVPGLIANARTDDGVILRQTSMSGLQLVESYRLRGFSADPNIMFLPFTFGVSACTIKLFQKPKFYYIATFMISAICIALTKSRMGIICCAASVLIACLVCIFSFDSVKKKASAFIAVLTGFVAVLLLSLTNITQTLLSGYLSSFENRSKLTDEFGRFSVWADALHVFWENNPLFGLGFANLYMYTSAQRMCHNTWLALLCENGIIIGSMIVLYFFVTMIIGWIKLPQKIKHCKDLTYVTMIVGYTVTIISLVSVDNTTCSYLWFGALLLLKMAFHHNKTDQAPTLSNQIS